MPMFILITGLFSKKEQSVNKIISLYILPYIIFDLIYVIWCLLLGKNANVGLLIPTYVYWYILCIAIQKLIVWKISNKYIILLCIIFIQIGTLFVPEDTWRILSIGRVALLFPIFYLGLSISFDKLCLLRRNKFLSILIGTGSIFINIVIYFSLSNSGLIAISAAHNYYSSLAELAIKYVYMCTTVGIFICANAILPENKTLCRWGRNSLIVYLVHPYFIDVISFVIKNVIKDSYISALLCIVFAIAITNFLSIDIFRKIYALCMKKISRILNLERV